MSNLFVFLSLVFATNAAVLSGMNLDPERLKMVDYLVHQGNDYMDFNPENQAKDLVIEVPDTNVVIGVPRDQRTYIQVSKMWSDDGRVEHSISVQPAARAAAPSVVDIQFPADQDVHIDYGNQYRN